MQTLFLNMRGDGLVDFFLDKTLPNSNEERPQFLSDIKRVATMHINRIPRANKH